MDKLRNGFSILKEHLVEKPKQQTYHPSCHFESGKLWLDLQFHKDDQIVKLEEVEYILDDPPGSIDEKVLDRIQGSLIGLALGDALGAHVEFRPRAYLLENPVEDFGKGGEWGLRKGQFTDNTSMALCLANSLVARHGFVPYDQLVRYKWWYQYGYMSSTGQCFNIGLATKDSLDEFIRRQQKFAKQQKIHVDKLDYLSDRQLLENFPVDCSKPSAAGSGALMRLAPVPLFFHEHLEEAIQLSGYSGQITHNDKRTYDACRYYAALIFAAVNGYNKTTLLATDFYEKHSTWFGNDPLCAEIKTIAGGSYQRKGGYDDGIRGKGYIVYALEAALWAFWSDEESFEKGALAAVNLGDDTDTTAAIYGQLAGAYYGYRALPKKWVDQVFAKKYLLKLSKWIAYEGKNWKETVVILSSDQSLMTNMNSMLMGDRPPDEYLMANLPSRWRKSYKTTLSPRTPRHDDIGFSALYSSCTTTPNVSFDTIEDIINGPTSLKSLPDMFNRTNPESSSVFTYPPKALDLNHCMHWSCEDVCNWIRSLGTVYETYVSDFQRKTITGDRLLNLVDEQTLVEFGVANSHHRRVIMHSINHLKAKYATSMASDDAQTDHFYDNFVGDFVPRLYLADSIYPNTMSCVLQPFEDETHATLYNQIIRWLGPLPSTVDIDKIEVVHNPESHQMFLQQINRTERKQTQEAFQPHLDFESNPTERRNVLDRMQTLVQEVNHNREAPVVRVWHGCKRAIVSQLVSDGFAALGKLDNGWFGKGIYFTSSAEYAVKYTNSTGCLIMCYVLLLNPFPVITDDAPPDVSSRNFRFYGRGNHSNYQCHYIPVSPVSEHTSSNFRPPPNGVQDARFDEFAIFQQADILPQVLVHLKPGISISTLDEKSPIVFLNKEGNPVHRKF